MDSLIAACARALATGDALGALKRVALREDPPALALRGIAMAQLGELVRARELLRRAAKGFGAHEARSRARCVVAEAEVALALRDLSGAPRKLLAAAATLEAQGDRANALHALLIAARRSLLLGRLEEAAHTLAQVEARAGQGFSPLLMAVAELSSAELAWRSLRTGAARAALDRAALAAQRAGVPALQAEVAQARAALDAPAARRLIAGGQEAALRLDEVEALLVSPALVVDACRHGLSAGAAWQALARRPILFALALELAKAWPGDVAREALIASAFRTRRPDETHRARLRVEVGRLRALIAPLAGIEASARGFVLRPHAAVDVVVILPPIEGEQASLLALLGDGAAWSTSALALALGASQRTVQRALAELEALGRVRAIGQARARRWLAPPLTGFTTALLLPAAMPFA
ncbi:helix-turn-helix domain-containing protein [Hydrogenophaga sp. BPS33]|uniref:helix-turn-helix domain-containing protein n=1 Tax=Hydrogenophaga sp. BPS33 TaxID=2651974 RepID=UPI0013202D3B|nr:helix-turn-helix domain-containing protein [Hydrogenophaga sp. BPS33]QHE88439.1 helix-turn-helix domain-containing protein [Hydrogenophaga sp. BPS33]